MGSRGAGASSAEGGPDRVVEAHSLARQSLGVCAVFVMAAVVAALFSTSDDAWLPLHLFLVGGLVSAVSGATQMLAITWSSGRPPVRAVSTTQQVLVAVGAIALAAGRQSGSPAAAATGGGVVTAALVLLAANLVGIRRSAATDRYLPAIDGYLAAIACGVAGGLIGSGLVAGASTGASVHPRNAHLFVNLFGFIGIVIAATLPYFAATQLRCKMSQRATPRRLRRVVIGLITSVAVATIGRLFAVTALTVIGLATYAVCLIATVFLLPTMGARQFAFAGPRAVQMLAGITWWIGISLALAVNAPLDLIDDSRLTQALVIGGYAPILASSVAYFAPVVRRGGHRLLTAGFAVLKSWPAIVAANIAAAATLFDEPTVVKAALAMWAFDAVARYTRFWRQGANSALTGQAESSRR